MPLRQNSLFVKKMKLLRLRLEKLNILDASGQWERLRETRNNLAHEYPFDIEEHIENIALAMEGFTELKDIYHSLKEAVYK